RLPSAAMASVPPETTVGPVKVFGPLSDRVPGPILLRVPAPPMGPLSDSRAVGTVMLNVLSASVIVNERSEALELPVYLRVAAPIVTLFPAPSGLAAPVGVRPEATTVPPLITTGPAKELTVLMVRVPEPLLVRP